jgi:uncharacterized membrane-anchored protein YhcB (DUF1043 family)
MTLATVAALAGLLVALGGIGAGIPKVVNAVRRASRVSDGILGDGTPEHPGVVAGQASLAAAIEKLRVQASADLADMKSDLAAVKVDVAAVKHQTASIEDKVDRQGVKLDEHVDKEAPDLLAAGQAWGTRLDEEVADHEGRIARLERHTGTEDPATGTGQ